MAHEPKDIVYQCCFCGEGIPVTDREPLDLVLGLEDDALQQFYCHVRCLKGHLHPSVPLAID